MIVKTSTRDAVTILAPAKINLFLQVLNKRPDGYHNINSLMQAVTLYDRLEFKRIKEDSCTVRIANDNVSEIPNNLIVKAFQLMKMNFNLKCGVEVTLEKKIPIAAGLAGGSSDCAATIIALNQLFGLALKQNEMIKIALQLGSDIPFFFSKGQALVTGRGEAVHDTSYPMKYKIVLVSPPLALSTESGYAALKMDLTSNSTPFNLKKDRTLEDFFESLAHAGNDFEKVQFEKHPELGAIKEKLVNCGARFARMSGSGPSIFGVFEHTFDTERVRANNFSGCQLYTVEPFCLP